MNNSYSDYSSKSSQLLFNHESVISNKECVDKEKNGHIEDKREEIKSDVKSSISEISASKKALSKLDDDIKNISEKIEIFKKHGEKVAPQVNALNVILNQLKEKKLDLETSIQTAEEKRNIVQIEIKAAEGQLEAEKSQLEAEKGQLEAEEDQIEKKQENLIEHEEKKVEQKIYSKQEDIQKTEESTQKSEKIKYQASKVNNVSTERLSEVEEINFEQEINQHKLKNIFLIMEDKLQSVLNYYQETGKEDFGEFFDQNKFVVAHPDEGFIAPSPALADKFKKGHQIPVILSDGSTTMMTVNKIQVLSVQQYAQFKAAFAKFGLFILKQQISQNEDKSSSNTNNVKDEERSVPVKSSKDELKVNGIKVKKADKKNKSKNIDQILQNLHFQELREQNRLKYIKHKKEEREREIAKEKASLKTYETRMENYKEDFKDYRIRKDNIKSETVKLEMQELKIAISETKQRISNINKEVKKFDQEIKKLEKTVNY